MKRKLLRAAATAFVVTSIVALATIHVAAAEAADAAPATPATVAERPDDATRADDARRAAQAAAENARLVREFVEKVYNEGRLDLIEKYIAPDFVDRSPGAPPDARGPAFVREQAEGTLALFPDLKFQNEDFVAERDRVVVRWSSTSTFTGAMGDVKGDGRPVTVSGISIMRIENGMIAESWDIVDRLSMFRQMGFALTPPKSAAE